MDAMCGTAVAEHAIAALKHPTIDIPLVALLTGNLFIESTTS
jgi:hypothetical protein